MASECDKRGPCRHGMCSKRKHGIAGEQPERAAETGRAASDQTGSEL